MPQRLDATVAARGLARSRTHAAALIADGLVSVDGRTVQKPSTTVTDSQRIEVAGADHYVSRAAHKLIAALDAFPVDVAGRTVLDAGASTGGFSQVLLERGAHRVIAIDVGHGQLAPQLLTEPRLTVLEGVNARDLTAARLSDLTGGLARPTLVVADLSFISLPLVLPALTATAQPDADLILLIKPQFEVGRGGVREGVVRDAALRADAVAGVLWAGFDLGYGTAGLIPSPVVGGAGNLEYLVWLSRSHGSNPTEWLQRAEQLTRE